jgi:hypothetical protein
LISETAIRISVVLKPGAFSDPDPAQGREARKMTGGIAIMNLLN